MHSGLQVRAEALLLSIARQSSVGNAVAALLNSPASSALLQPLEDVTRRFTSDPINQVRTCLWDFSNLTEAESPARSCPQ